MAKRNPRPADEQTATEAARAVYREMGSTGLTRFGGAVGQTLREEWQRELRGAEGRKLYSQMRWSDPVISAVFFAMEWSMKHVRWFAEAASDAPEDREAADFVDQCLADMSFSWSDTLSFILTMWEFGFSLLEVVGKKRLGHAPSKYAGLADPAPSQYDDGLWGWRKWVPRPADSLASGGEWLFDEAGGIQGAVQQAPPDYTVRKLPIERLLLFRTSVAPKNSPESQPILRGMYTSYYFGTNISEIEGIGIERDLAGLPVVYLGRDCTLEGTHSDYEVAKDLVRNIRRDEQEGVVVPKPKLGTAGEGVGMLLELLSTGGSRQFDTNEIIDRYDKYKAMAVLGQFIFLGMQRSGTYALAEVLQNMWQVALGGWADSICEVVTRYAVPKLFRYNAGRFRVEQLPRLSHSEVGLPNLEVVSEYVNKLVGASVLTPGPELEDHLRGLARLPAMPAEAEEGSEAFAGDGLDRRPTYDYLRDFYRNSRRYLPDFWWQRVSRRAAGHAGGKAYPALAPVGEGDELPGDVAEGARELWRRTFNAALRATRDRDAAKRVADAAVGAAGEPEEEASDAYARPALDVETATAMMREAREHLDAAELLALGSGLASGAD